jgi:hypothetical protein
MNTPKKLTLVIGLVACAVAALFPPRFYIGGYDMNRPPTHCFLFSPKFQTYYAGDYGASPMYPVTVDGGRLLAELALIIAITGIVYLFQMETRK